MADEATIRSSLLVRCDTLNYQSYPTSFQADVAGEKGPTPGAITVTTEGTSVDLSELTTPGLCRIMNLDATNYATYGIWDPENDTFFPLGELLPGETYVLRLSRDLQEEFGTGTGTTGADTNRLRFKADTASVVVLVEAFEA